MGPKPAFSLWLLLGLVLQKEASLKELVQAQHCHQEATVPGAVAFRWAECSTPRSPSLSCSQSRCSSACSRFPTSCLRRCSARAS